MIFVHGQIYVRRELHDRYAGQQQGGDMHENVCRGVCRPLSQNI